MILFWAMLVDAVLGEPRWLWQRIPHPVVLMGRLIGALDQRFNEGERLRLKGVAVIGGLVLGAALLGLVLQWLPGDILDIAVLAVLLAQRSLSDHVLAVAKGLRRSTAKGAEAVAMIVGRDTSDMDTPAIVRAGIESAAENLSDGVIAPIFWFVVAGLPGLLVYKIVNTADSMIGYLTPRHAAFGWAAARLDDVLNFIPARLTALMITGVTLAFDRLPDIFEDAPAHRSPNAGWPEAAMAHGLNIALSGPRSYDGEMHDYPYVNDGGIRELDPSHLREAVLVLWLVWAVVLIPAGLVGWLF